MSIEMLALSVCATFSTNLECCSEAGNVLDPGNVPSIMMPWSFLFILVSAFVVIADALGCTHLRVASLCTCQAIQ